MGDRPTIGPLDLLHLHTQYDSGSWAHGWQGGEMGEVRDRAWRPGMASKHGVERRRWNEQVDKACLRLSASTLL